MFVLTIKKNIMLKEFKKFISKGNVMEMAVGLIMATYFGAIIKSLVNDILMPPLGKMMGGVDFTKLKMIIQEPIDPVLEGETVVVEGVEEVAIMYGNFINHIITFVIVAFCIFMIVKAYNKMKERMEKKEETPTAAPTPSKEEVLLTEIRDLLKK